MKLTKDTDGLSVRARRLVRQMNLETWEQISQTSDRDFLVVAGCGEFTLREIRARQSDILTAQTQPDAMRKACQAAYGLLWAAYLIESESRSGLKFHSMWDEIEKVRGLLRAALKGD